MCWSLTVPGNVNLLCATMQRVGLYSTPRVQIQLVIYERLSGGDNELKKTTRERLEQFGAAGLRTLCLAYRNLTSDEYEKWNERYIQAKSALRDQEKKLDEVAEQIEKELILIGCTAIEDKLQEGVPACIETLSRAGIKIMVLTGDKLETAIHIAMQVIK